MLLFFLLLGLPIIFSGGFEVFGFILLILPIYATIIVGLTFYFVHKRIAWKIQLTTGLILFLNLLLFRLSAAVAGDGPHATYWLSSWLGRGLNVPINNNPPINPSIIFIITLCSLVISLFFLVAGELWNHKPLTNFFLVVLVSIPLVLIILNLVTNIPLNPNYWQALKDDAAFREKCPNSPCFIKVESTPQPPQDCSKLTEEKKDSCLQRNAIILHDKTLCEQIQTPDIKDSCYQGEAGALKDVTFCDKILDQRRKNQCYEDSASYGSDPSVCEKIILDESYYNYGNGRFGTPKTRCEANYKYYIAHPR